MTRKHRTPALSSRSKTVSWLAATCKPLFKVKSPPLRLWQEAHSVGKTCRPLEGFFFNYSLDKNRIKALISWSLMHFGEKVALNVAEKVKEVGFEYATQAGASLGLEDLKIPPTKATLVSQAELDIQLTQASHLQGNLTALERFQHLIDTWHRSSENLKKDVVRYFRSTDLLNPVYMMAFSGARGNISQVGQLVGMRGLMADPKGQIISFPIRSNFREGLTLTEYVISCYGARKGLVDTALRTANAGYLTRRLVDVSHHVVVSQFDCKTNRGIVLRSLLENGKDRLPLQSRLTGRVLARDLCIREGLPIPTDPFPAEFQEELYQSASPEDLLRPSGKVSSGNKANLDLQTTRRISPALSWQRILYELAHYDRPGKMWVKREVVGSRNQQISYGLAEKIAALWDKVLVRSPLSCNRLNSICQLCYGWSLAEGQLVFLGEAVGVIAAQSIGEPGTQLTMRTFHTGGVFSGDVVDEIKAPHEGWVEFAAPLQGKLIRTSHGKIAFRTKVRSRLVVSTAQPVLGNRVKAAEGSGFKIPPLTVLFVRQGEYVADNQLVAEVPIEDTGVDDKVLEPFYYSSELEGKVFFENLRLNLVLGERNTRTSTSGGLGSIWVLSGQVPAALDCSFLTDGDFIDQRSVLSRESGWLSWEGVVSNLSTLVQNKTRYQGKESREGPLTERPQNPLCKPYQPLLSKRITRFQVGQKGVRGGCFATNLSTRLAGQAQRGKRLLSGLGNDNIDINQTFLSLPWADIQYKKVGYLLSHPTNRRSNFLCPQPWLTQHAKPLTTRETCALQPPSRPKGSAPGTTRHDCFFVSSSLSKVFKTAFEARRSLKLCWFPIQYRTETGSLTRNSGLYLFKGLSRGQLLWTIEEGYRVRLMRYNRGKQTDLVLHARRKSKPHQNYRQLYTASLLWALARCRGNFSHLATLASKKEGVSAFAKHRLLKQPNTRQPRTRTLRTLNSGVLPRTKQLGKKVHRCKKPLSSAPAAPAAKGRAVTGKPFNWPAPVLQAKQGTKRLQGSPLIGKQPVGANVVGLQPCGIQLKWVERGFVLGLQNNLQGNQVLLTAPFNGWLAAPSLLQPLPSGCKARKPGKTKPHTTFKGGKNLLKGCLEKSVDRSYRARIQTLSPLLLNTVRELVRRKQDRNRLVGLNLALTRNRACSVLGVCTPGPDKSASPKARNLLFYNRPRTANTIRCQTGFLFNQPVEAWPWPVMVTRGSCAEISLKEHKSGLGAALHAKKPLLLSLLRRRSHKYKSLIQNPCPPLKLLGGGLVFLEAHVDRCFDHSLARLYSKKLFLWDVKQNSAHKLRFWAVDCGEVFDSRKAKWERKGWSLNRIKLGNHFSYTSLKGLNVWHDCLVSKQKPSPFLAREKRRPCPRRGLLLLGVPSNMPSTGLAYAMRNRAATQLKMKPGLIFFSRTQTRPLPPQSGGSRAQAALLHQSFLPPGLAISNCYFQAYKEKVASLEEGSGVTFGKGQMQATSKSKAQAERVGPFEERGKDRLVAKEEFALCGVLLQRSNGLASQLAGLVNFPGKPARGVWRLTGHESLSFNSTFVSTDSVRTFPFYSTGTLKSWLQDRLCSRVSLKESKTSLPAATRTNTANPLPTRQQMQQAGNRVRGCGPSCDNLHKTLHLSSKLGFINSTDQHAAKNQGTILLLKQDLCSNQPRSGAGFTLKQTTKINTRWQPWQCKANATVLGQNSQSNSFLLPLRLVFSGVRVISKLQKRFLFDLYRGFAFNEFLPLFLVLGNNNSRWTIDYKNAAAACTHTKPLDRYQEWLIGRRRASHQPLPGADPFPTKQVVPTNQGVHVTRVKPFERGLPGLTGFSLKQTTHKTPAPSNANRFQGQEKKHLHAHRTGGTRASVAGGATGNLQSWVDLQSNMSLHPLGLKLLATVLSLVGKGPNLEGKKQFNKGFSFRYPNNSTFGFRQLARAKNGAGHDLDHLTNQNLHLLACKVQSCSVLADSQHKRVIYESATCSGSAGTHSVRQGASPRPKHRETGLEFSKFNHKSNKQWPDEIEIAGPKLLSVKLNPIIRFKGSRKPMRASVAKDWLDEFYYKVDLNFTPASIYVVASILAVSAVLVTITRLRYQGVDLNLTRLGVCTRMQTAKDKQTGVLNTRETSFIRLFVCFQTPAAYLFALVKSHILPISSLPHRQGLCRAFYANPYRLSMLNDRLTIDQVLLFAISYQNRFVCDFVGEEMLSGKALLCNKQLHTPASFAPSIACFSTPALHRFKAGRGDSSHARAMSQACCAYLVHQNGGLARNKVSHTLSRRVLAFGKRFHLTFSKRGPQPVKLGKQAQVVRRRNKVLTHRNGWTSSVLTCNFGAYAGEVTSSLNGFGCLVLTSKDQTSFSLLGKPLKPGYPHRGTNVDVGQLIRYGQEVSPENRAAVSTSGQVLQITSNTLTVRKAHPTRIPAKSLLCVEQGRFIKKQENLLVMWYQKLTTGDIVQGIPKVEQLFEARQTKAGVPIPNNLSDRLAFFFDSYQTETGQRRADKRFLTTGDWYESLLVAWARGWQLRDLKGVTPLGLAARQSVKRVQLVLVESIQRVYLSQGVVISDKHLEVVARQMTSKARIVEGGSHGLVHDELVDLNLVERYNSFLFQSEAVRYEPTVLGITKTSLESRSSLSAASFQETRRVLSKAGIQPKLDLLGGLKQRVIIGDLIGAGTGFVPPGFKNKGDETLPEDEKGSEAGEGTGDILDPRLSTN